MFHRETFLFFSLFLHLRKSFQLDFTTIYLSTAQLKNNLISKSSAMFVIEVKQ